jgi:hypothetical protein
MRKLLFALAITIAAAIPASAALPVGAKAPDFVTTGAIAGKPFRLHLEQMLEKGPVVLYFFPKAFTKGCTLEAHAFSEAAAEFRKAGARVIGMSGDDLATLQRFSIEACRNAFPVATAVPRPSPPTTSRSPESRDSATAPRSSSTATAVSSSSIRTPTGANM